MNHAFALVSKPPFLLDRSSELSNQIPSSRYEDLYAFLGLPGHSHRCPSHTCAKRYHTTHIGRPQGPCQMSGKPSSTRREITKGKHIDLSPGTHQREEPRQGLPSYRMGDRHPKRQMHNLQPRARLRRHPRQDLQPCLRFPVSRPSTRSLRL